VPAKGRALMRSPVAFWCLAVSLAAGWQKSPSLEQEARAQGSLPLVLQTFMEG
jgi:hypothetical protein